MYRMQAGMAMAHLFTGRLDDVTNWAEKAFRGQPGFLVAVAAIAASHALPGRIAEAKRAMRQLRELDPGLRVSTLGEWLPIRRAEDRKVFAKGLGKAGLPG